MGELGHQRERKPLPALLGERVRSGEALREGLFEELFSSRGFLRPAGLVSLRFPAIFGQVTPFPTVEAQSRAHSAPVSPRAVPRPVVRVPTNEAAFCPCIIGLSTDNPPLTHDRHLQPLTAYPITVQPLHRAVCRSSAIVSLVRQRHASDVRGLRSSPQIRNPGRVP